MMSMKFWKRRLCAVSSQKAKSSGRLFVGNIVVKVLVDLIVGSIIFGALWIPVRMMTELEISTLADLHGDLVDVIFGEVLTRLTNGWLFFQFLNFTIVQVEWRLPSLATMQLMMNVFVGSCLRIFLPWVQTLESFQDSIEIGKERRILQEVFRNSTVQSNASSATISAVLPLSSNFEYLEG
ncbi:Hypothetical protein R9X50_00283500 [Acrodontium crateriforme]|uniref:Uncharacterized protein n=1 Tax=Acrodontium crateriforme TaxID=150365 RepID=A0AAQ3M1M3_9PEZI|nr:Hypothetical protein R9X50_00283500 [Acrodontium crateriforme]